MRERGFTLVEMTAALAVAGLVALTAYLGVRTAMEQEAAARASRDAAARAWAVRAQIMSWIGAVDPTRPGPGMGFSAVNRNRDGQAADALTLETRAPDPFRPGRARVRLYVDVDAGLVAEITRADGRRRRRVLAPGATGLDLRFLLPLEGERRWAEEWRSTTQLPAAVRVRVLGDSLPPLLAAPVTVALPWEGT